MVTQKLKTKTLILNVFVILLLLCVICCEKLGILTTECLIRNHLQIKRESLCGVVKKLTIPSSSVLLEQYNRLRLISKRKAEV